jgi:NADH dehydrogenase [ubiquinone] 1 alpha subcomplex assembly factor 1
MTNDQETRGLPWAAGWSSVDDRIMGGVSRSSWQATSDDAAIFSGAVSLESGGGFCSVRSPERDWGLGHNHGIEFQVRGDGKTYKVSVRTSPIEDGESYQFRFRTEPDTLVKLSVPWSDFILTFRGRAVPNPAVLKPAAIRTIGFLVGERQEGAFQLSISSLRGLNAPNCL